MFGIENSLLGIIFSALALLFFILALIWFLQDKSEFTRRIFTTAGFMMVGISDIFEGAILLSLSMFYFSLVMLIMAFYRRKHPLKNKKDYEGLVFYKQPRMQVLMVLLPGVVLWVAMMIIHFAPDPEPHDFQIPAKAMRLEGSDHSILVQRNIYGTTMTEDQAIARADVQYITKMRKHLRSKYSLGWCWNSFKEGSTFRDSGKFAEDGSCIEYITYYFPQVLYVLQMGMLGDYDITVLSPRPEKGDDPRQFLEVMFENEADGKQIKFTHYWDAPDHEFIKCRFGDIYLTLPGKGTRPKKVKFVSNADPFEFTDLIDEFLQLDK